MWEESVLGSRSPLTPAQKSQSPLTPAQKSRSPLTQHVVFNATVNTSFFGLKYCCVLLVTLKRLIRTDCMSCPHVNLFVILFHFNVQLMKAWKYFSYG